MCLIKLEGDRAHTHTRWEGGGTKYGSNLFITMSSEIIMTKSCRNKLMKI